MHHGVEGAEAERTNAKRKMNSPYGKTATSPIRLNKMPIFCEDGVDYKTFEEHCDSIYLPYGMFVTAQARNITIRNAQKNYDRFVYADTDSLHIIGDAPVELEIDDVKLGAWKIEGDFPHGKYMRSKRYIHADKNYKLVDIKCAGMPDEVKSCLTWDTFYEGYNFENRDIKIVKKQVKGGCLLTRTKFTLKA